MNKIANFAPAQILAETIGQRKAEIPVELSTRFLQHFSEQLYSSPQKAFEELISNGWDAGADYVDVRISHDLNNSKSTMCVLDNGISMNEDGLRNLWHIAFSQKQDNPNQFGRPLIGKFGIGKLATYVLAGKLTYICKAKDGIIRRVTMNYSDIDKKKDQQKDHLLSELKLQLYEIDKKDLKEAFSDIQYGDNLYDLICKGVPIPNGTLIPDEFGGEKSVLQKPKDETWTLVILSDLKPIARDLKIGILRRMLEAALPVGSEMAISINGELLSSSKADIQITKEWIIGTELGFDSIEVEEDISENVSTDNTAEQEANTKIEVVKFEAKNEPVPHIVLPGIGQITGRIKLYESGIAGGKSELRGVSNGFRVNVLGRVVNARDPSFGEENLSHSAWARFRMTVRADGLNLFLTTDRERFRDTKELKLFRAFIRKAFNLVRTEYDNDESTHMPHGGDVLVQSLGIVSLAPLRNVVTGYLSPNNQQNLPIFDDQGISNREEKRKSWQKDTSENIKNALEKVKFEKIEDDSFVKFRISDSSIVVNKEHPFVAEYSHTKAEKELVRTVAMVNLLTDIYTLDLGIKSELLQSIQKYRDQLMRFNALRRRKSGIHIAQLLLKTQHDSSSSKKLENVVSDAFRYLGFDVKDLAKPGEPEGIAYAYPLPTKATPSKSNPTPPLYSFSFDAKSSKHEVAQTNNINLAGIIEHKRRYSADYALVIAPGYSEGSLATRCAQQQVTPITAQGLGKLLEYTALYGAIPLDKIREIFSIYNPEELARWIESLEPWLKQQRKLTLDTFLRALNELKGQIPDALSASTISLICRTKINAPEVKDVDVISLATGLSILVPDLIGVIGDKVAINASTERVAAAVESQLEKLRNVQDRNGDML